MAHIYNGILSRNKQNEIVKTVGKEMKSENIMMTEVTQKQTHKSHIFILIFGY